MIKVLKNSLLTIFSLIFLITCLELTCGLLLKKNMTIEQFLPKQKSNYQNNKMIKPKNEKLHLLNKNQKPPVNKPDMDYSNAYKLKMASQYYHKPNASAQATLTTPSEILYDVTYNIDSYSRRIGLKHQNKNKYLLTVGGSFVFGEGVEDHQTLASKISQYSHYFQGYNFGSQGAAINNIMHNLKTHKNYQKGVKEKNGYIIYMLYDYHFKRLFSQFNYPDEKKKTHRKLVTDPLKLNYDKNGVFIGNSRYSKDKPFIFWLKNKLVHSRTLKFLDIGIPIRWQKKHFEYLELLLKDFSKDSKKYFGTNKTFLILAHFFKPQLKEQIKQYFKQSNIIVIDLEDIGFGDSYIHSNGKMNYYIRGDGHPNHVYYEVLGEVLAGYFDSYLENEEK